MNENVRMRAYSGALVIGSIVFGIGLAAAGPRVTIGSGSEGEFVRVSWTEATGSKVSSQEETLARANRGEARIDEPSEYAELYRYGSVVYDFDNNIAFLSSRSALTHLPNSVAAIGLYATPADRESLPSDSMISVSIWRDRTDQRLVLNLNGGLRTWNPGQAQRTASILRAWDPGQTRLAGAILRLFVYPSQADADKDSVEGGTTSLFFGEVTLSNRIETRGAFAVHDFELQRGKGVYTARPAGSYHLHVNVPDVDAAVVRLVADVGEVSPAEADSTEAQEIAKPALTMMWDPRPNPARQGVTFRFSLSHRLPAKLVLFDVQGRRVKTLINRVLDAGPQDFTWDRTDSRGNHSKSGMYFARFEADNKSFTKRFVLIR